MPSSWKTPAVCPLPEEFEGFGVIQGDVVQVEFPAVAFLDQLARTRHDCQRGKTEEIHLQQTHRFHDRHLELDDRFDRVILGSVGGAVQRRVFDDRAVGDHHPRGVCAGVAHHPLHFRRRYPAGRAGIPVLCITGSTPASGGMASARVIGRAGLLGIVLLHAVHL